MRWGRLGDVAEAIRGVTFPASELVINPAPGLIACLTTSAVHEPLRWSTARYIPLELLGSSGQVLCRGDILVSTANSKPNVGTSARVDSLPFQATFGAFVTVVRPRSQVDSAFLAYWLRTSWFLDAANSLASQTTNIANLRVSDLMATQMPLPPLDEQRGIAALLNDQLSSIDRARRDTIDSSTAARDLRERLLDDKLGSRASDGWPKLPFRELLVKPLRTGVSGPEAEDGQMLGLSIASIRDGRLSLARTKRVSVSSSTDRIVSEGAFYIVRGNGRLNLVGRGGIAPQPTAPVVFPDLMIEAHLDRHQVDLEFLSMIWSSRPIRVELESRASTAAGIHKINLANLGGVPVSVPSIAEQRRIVVTLQRRLTALDAIETSIHDRQLALEALPAALLRQTFAHLVA